MNPSSSCCTLLMNFALMHWVVIEQTLAAEQVAAWYMLSEPVSPSAGVAGPEKDTTAAASSSQADAATAAEQERITYAQLVEDMIPMAGGRDGPPPALARNGEFSDWVYTMASEKYDRSEVRACPGSAVASPGHCGKIAIFVKNRGSSCCDVHPQLKHLDMAFE